MAKLNEEVADFWVTHYIDPQSGLCSLCRNKGEIVTAYGQKTFCFCPNGQALRAGGFDD
jgi:hypothetical protein